MNKLTGFACMAACAVITISLITGDPVKVSAQDQKEEVEDTSGDEEKPKYFSLDAGIKGNYSAGGAPKNFYYYPFLNVDFTYKWFSLTAGYRFYGNYQLSDAAGDYSRIFYHRPSAGMAFNIKDIVKLSADYELSTGQQGYLCHTVTPSLDIEYKKFYMNSNFSYATKQYRYVNSFYNWFDPITGTAQPGRYHQYDSNKIRRKGWSLSITPGFYVHETTALEIGYSHSEEYTESLTYSGLYYLSSYVSTINPLMANRLVNKVSYYYSNTVSLGLSSQPIEQLSLQAAANIGKDSAKYITAGCDLGFTIKLFKMIKIAFTYSPTRYIPPEKTGLEKLQEKGSELRSVGNILYGRFTGDWSRYASDYYYEKYAGTRGNPDLSETSGKAYWYHNINLGVTYSY